ncbi:hypothetical protein [Roseateles oligotrophus]|nr:hypothetical protein [Roseateles oligotrophus]
MAASTTGFAKRRKPLYLNSFKASTIVADGLQRSRQQQPCCKRKSFEGMNIMSNASKFSDQTRSRVTFALILLGASALSVIAASVGNDQAHNSQLLVEAPSAGAIATPTAMDNSVPSASEVFATATAAKFSDDQPDGF